MGEQEPREQARLIALLGVGAAILLIATVVIVVLTQLFAPLLGVTAGAPSDAVIGSMLVWAGIALGILPVSMWVRRR